MIDLTELEIILNELHNIETRLHCEVILQEDNLVQISLNEAISDINNAVINLETARDNS